MISVQARQILEETDLPLEQANANDFIKGVVGWVPLADTNITEVLDRYKNADKLKAVRHVVQGEPDGFLDGGHSIAVFKHFKRRASFTTF